MTDEQRLATVTAGGCGDYKAVRMLPDGSIAVLHDLIFTRSIMLDCDEYSFADRFCFDDRALATQRFAELTSCDDVPQGHIASRHRPGR